MSDVVLVTYATATGSTEGVAVAIAHALREKGLQVALHPMRDVDDVTPYRAVVAGSAVQGGAWLPEAVEFVRKNQSALAKRPFAPFLVCMTLAMKKGQYRDAVNGWLAPVRALVKPVSEGLFAGALDLSKVPSFSDRLKFRVSVALGVWSEGDHRDWDAIRRWALELAPQL